MKKSLVVLLGTFVLFSCNTNKKGVNINTTEAQKPVIAATYKSIEVAIEGMTCEIGCARTIQSKLAKLDGVIYSKVNFETKKGIFTYDSNLLNKKDIVTKIDGIAGGDLYKVIKTTDIKDIIKKTE